MNTCPSCSAEVPADAPNGLCPSCLLTAALPEQSADQTPTAAGWETIVEDFRRIAEKGIAEAATRNDEDTAAMRREAEVILEALGMASKGTRPMDVFTLEHLPALIGEWVRELEDDWELWRLGHIRERLSLYLFTTPDQRDRVEELFSRRLPELELESFLGAGGMGEVWLAEHSKLERHVAVKLLSEEVASEPGFAERFRREAQAMAKLDHPNVVKIYDFGESEGVFFLVMEYHPGDLRARMKKGPLPPDDASSVMQKLCEAVSAVHAAGLIHRDLKPENVLLNDKGLKLTDFGLARAGAEKSLASRGGGRGGRLTEAGSLVGTPAYMAPEQWRTPDAVDARCDLYALGLILCEMLTGKLPRGRYTPPSAVCGNRWMDVIVARALDPDPAKRYQTVDEMLKDLEKADKAQSLNRPRLRIVVLLSDLARLIPLAFFLVALIYLTAHGLSVAKQVLFPIGMLVLWLGPKRDEMPVSESWWVRWVNAITVTASLLVFTVLGPALGQAYQPDGMANWVLPLFETVAMVVSSSMAALLLLWGFAVQAVQVGRGKTLILSCLGVLVGLLGTSLVGYYVPGMGALGLWMPFVLTAVNLALLWGFGYLPPHGEDAPVVEAPFVESPFGA